MLSTRSSRLDIARKFQNHQHSGTKPGGQRVRALYLIFFVQAGCGSAVAEVCIPADKIGSYYEFKEAASKRLQAGALAEACENANKAIDSLYSTSVAYAKCGGMSTSRYIETEITKYRAEWDRVCR